MSEDERGVQPAWVTANEIPFFNMQGERVSMDELSELSADFSKRIVARDQIGDVLVSTVLIGIDMSFGMIDGPPLIFESMIFGADEDWALHETMRRYATRDAALAGHAELLTIVRHEIELGTNDDQPKESEW